MSLTWWLLAAGAIALVVLWAIARLFLAGLDYITRESEDE